MVEAQRILMELGPVMPATTVPLSEAAGFALAADIRADADVPPFHRAMMDGYAVRSAAIEQYPARLRISGFIPAGQASSGEVDADCAAKIMTGAPLPPGADAVQRIEVCREAGDGYVEILEPLHPGRNVAVRGSEFPRQAVALTRGHLLRSSDMGILATFGLATVPVFAKPRLALLNTGSELQTVSAPPRPGYIRNSNQYTLCAFYAANGFPLHARGIVPDTTADISTALASCADFDLILLTGGVSMGDLDLVAGTLKAEGFTIAVETVAIKPGKPLVVAHRAPQLVIGLAGNPVSSLVQSALFVLPLVRKMAGWSCADNPFHQAILRETVRHRPDRTSFRPGRLSSAEGTLYCTPQADKGSADLFAYRAADCLFTIPAGVPQLDVGERVQVMPLPGFQPVAGGGE
ncbi:MAG: molybdopterin molybdotransferase MoeA [Acidobacteria bacterium]|nr:molybdopterin molybdotransferase MoeA [Acidobacteriota bacterium]